MPLGHDISAIRAERHMVGAVCFATDTHFIACPAVGTSVLGNLPLHHATKAGSLVKHFILIQLIVVLFRGSTTWLRRRNLAPDLP
jgi:hypothetical protein